MFCGGCSLLLFLVLYPISGILAFAGCILILRDYPDFERGWSFDLCLASSILILIEIIITMAFIRVIGSSKTKSDGKSEEAFEAKDNNKDAEAQTQSNTHGYSIMRFAQVAITVGAKAAKNVIGVK
ncbi:uncharacterized protein LOC133186421 [Saccostrea echinata]|uniref:uncharacterized protein LOC133186421 n=1 Tax=Saccostrea echinata TaxID=191078 RepID=UPI002A802E82|nr:uncharacterized protein LOC133186421 [Saccostrea echinata]